MKNYAILRLLLAAVMIYFAWPALTTATSPLQLVFWAIWVGVFLLVAGSNFANLLQIIAPPVMEQEYKNRYSRSND